MLPPAPVVDKPYLDITDIPMMPPSPVLEFQSLRFQNNQLKTKEKEELKLLRKQKVKRQGKTLPSSTGINTVNFIR